MKVDHNQRVEKLFFSALSFDSPRKESLFYELKLRIRKLNKMTTHDEGDYCVAFQEMLSCAKVTGSADSICYRLNLKITAAEPLPVEVLPSSISSCPARGTLV